MGTTVAVRFLDTDDQIKGGELVNPFTVDDLGGINFEYVGDGEVDIMRVTSKGVLVSNRVHASRVANMWAVAG